MSDTLICFVPTRRGKTAGPKVWKRASKLVEAAIPCECVTLAGTDRVKMVHDHNGPAYKVVCGHCGKDARKWFAALVSATVEEDRAYQFESLEIVSPCCGQPSSLDELRFSVPVVWAEQWLEVMNPKIECDEALLGQLRDKLAELIGCEVRTIWVHD